MKQKFYTPWSLRVVLFCYAVWVVSSLIALVDYNFGRWLALGSIFTLVTSLSYWTWGCHQEGSREIGNV